MVTGNARVSDLAVAKVRRFCDQRVPAEARDEVCLEVTTRAATITIVERRPLWQGGPGGWTRMSIAQLRYDTAAGTWTCTGRTATDAGTATTTSTQPPSSTTSSRKSTRTSSSCSGDSAAPTGIAARDQLVRLPQRCLQTPSITVAIARFGSISVRLSVYGGRGLHAADLQRRLRREVTVPWPFGSHRLQPGAYGEAW